MSRPRKRYPVTPEQNRRWGQRTKARMTLLMLASSEHGIPIRDALVSITGSSNPPVERIVGAAIVESLGAGNWRETYAAAAQLIADGWMPTAHAPRALAHGSWAHVQSILQAIRKRHPYKPPNGCSEMERLEHRQAYNRKIGRLFDAALKRAGVHVEGSSRRSWDADAA